MTIGQTKLCQALEYFVWPAAVPLSHLSTEDGPPDHLQLTHSILPILGEKKPDDLNSKRALRKQPRSGALIRKHENDLGERVLADPIG